MIKTLRRAAVLFIAVPALAACGSGDKEASPDASHLKSAKILDGSISDDMLPYDTLTSQAPPVELKKEAGEGKGEAAASTADESETAAANEEAAESDTTGEQPSEAAPE